ncbi:MAG: twin-arginine translocase subunit TatC [Candidatus Manganitrophaceae bacterium]
MKRPAGIRETVEMPVSGHLRELRSRLIKAVLILTLFSGLAFYFSENLLVFLRRPLRAELVFLAPAEAFWADLKVSLFLGLVAALPFVFYEVWQFVAPGLRPEERGALLPFLVLSVFFFFVGMAFCYFVALPFALEFLIDYGRRSGITPQISVSMYVDFNLKFLIGFGLAFELPLVMLLLSRMGLLTPAFLARNRKYAAVLAFVIAAILTPTPDIFNQCIMAIPLILLYELGIFAVKIFGGVPTSAGKQPTEGTS